MIHRRSLSIGVLIGAGVCFVLFCILLYGITKDCEQKVVTIKCFEKR